MGFAPAASIKVLRDLCKEQAAEIARLRAEVERLQIYHTNFESVARDNERLEADVERLTAEVLEWQARWEDVVKGYSTAAALATDGKGAISDAPATAASASTGSPAGR